MTAPSATYRSEATATAHSAPVLPRKVLTGLAVGVALAHALVLQVAGNAINAPTSVVTRPFTTRAVPVSVAEVAPDSAAPARLAAPPPRPAPRPTPKRLQRPAASPDAPSEAEAVSAPNTAATPAEAASPAADIQTPQTPGIPETVAAAAPEPAASAPQIALPAKPAVTPAAPPPTAAVALTIPGSVRLLYKTEARINNVPWHVNGELLWLQDGATYDARLELSVLGLRKIYSSKGKISAEGLLPIRFGDKFRSAEVAAHFERDKQKVVFSANTPDVPLLPGMQDQLSVVLQVSAMFAGAPGKYPPGTQLSFDIIGPRHPDTWVFEVQGEETLSLPNGEFATVKLTRPKRSEFDRSDEFWLAPKLGYLPVRIKFTERNGDFIDQQWRATETP